MLKLIRASSLVFVQTALLFKCVTADEPLFTLTKEIGEESTCRVTNGGLCIESDKRKNQPYPASVRCNWAINAPATLTVDFFDLGEKDRLRIDNVPFSKQNGPEGVVVQRGSRFRFIVQEKTDVPASEDFGIGFKICATPPPTNPAFALTRKVGDDACCLVTNGGQCIESDKVDVQDYGSSFTCIWSILREVELHTHFFLLGANDRLRVENVPFKGTDDPDGVTPEVGKKIKFIVEESTKTPNNEEFAEGFKICSFPEGET